jgi:RecB family endonuclease NucS
MVLRQSGNGWNFASEAILEDFVWQHLPSLLECYPLKRQYFSDGDVCDILALTTQKQLVVIELKNVEDRYIVSQLTRYYESLLRLKPFQPEVDYKLPIRLLAVAPTFHRHNWVDKAHSKLAIEFWQFEVHQEATQFYLQLKNADTGQIATAAIPHQVVNAASFGDQTAPPPKRFSDWLDGCTAAEQQGLLRIRATMLGFDQRLQEVVTTKNIQYGRGQKVCAELRFSRKTGKPVLFLRITLPTFGVKKKVVGRMRVWLEGDDAVYVGHVPDGLGKMKTLAEWAEEGVQSHRLSSSWSSKSSQPIEVEAYLHRVEQPAGTNALDTLVNLALQKWLEKL